MDLGIAGKVALVTASSGGLGAAIAEALAAEGAAVAITGTNAEKLAKVESAIRAKGGKVIMPKSPISDTSWWAFFEDPDGNVMGLYEGITEVEH